MGQMGVGNSPTSVHKISESLSAPKNPEGLVAGTPFFWAGQTTLIITQAKELLQH